MNQEKLAAKVEELFGDQGFEVERKEGGRYTAIKDDLELCLHVFSSELYEIEDIRKREFKENSKVFVDEKMSQLVDILDVDVSVISISDEDPDYNLPSFEIIGDIAIINEIQGYDEERVIEGIRYYNPHIETILVKEEPLKGEFRLGEYKKIYGDSTETIHKEFGCKFKVDPTKVFFSEREGSERKRVLDSCASGEKILVMFAGVFPYPILIAKNKDVDVVGIEKNPDAVDFARENISLNGVEDSVRVIEGDVSEEVDGLGVFDRIIMPSPTNAFEFLEDAFSVAEEGTEVIIYGVSERAEPYKQLIDAIRQVSESKNFGFEILDKRIVSDYSPSKYKVAVEFRVNSV